MQDTGSKNTMKYGNYKYILREIGPVSNKVQRSTTSSQISRCVRPSGRETTTTLCPGNNPCVHDTKEVRFLKTSCEDFLRSGVKYQHTSPPSPEIDYIPLRVELREQATRTLLEVLMCCWKLTSSRSCGACCRQIRHL